MCPGEGGAQEGTDVGFANITATSLTTSGDVTVGGNLNVTGDGPHNMAVAMTNATGNEVGITIDCTANKSTSGEAVCRETNITDISSPGLLLFERNKTAGSNRYARDSDGKTTWTAGNGKVVQVDQGGII